MLDQLKLKPVEVPVKAASSRAPEKKKDLEGSLEAQEFKSELDSASKVADSDKPSKENKTETKSEGKETVSPEAQLQQAVGPVAFDPSMTQAVEEAILPEAIVAEGLVAPKLTDDQVKALAQAEEAAPVVEAELDAEMTQALLKTPKVNPNTGRAPAIELTKSEVDPQLMNMEDFVAQKNLAAKKNIQSNAYGMNKQQVQKLAQEMDLKSTQVVKDLGSLENPNSGSTNSQQFILNMMKEQGNSNALEVHAPVKIFDMSNIKTSNASEIMNQITDYVVQAKAAKEPTVNMRINHQELGMIDITVQKTFSGLTPDGVAINIGAHSLDGKTFFQQNSKDLFTHLSQSGVNVSDLKIETPSQTAKNDFDMNQGSDQKNSGNKQFGSEQNQRRHDSERRQDLWKLFNQEAA